MKSGSIHPARNYDVPVADIDLHDPSFLSDPYPALRRLQDKGPIHFHEGSNTYLVTRHRDISRMLGSADLFASDHNFVTTLFGGSTMEAMDNPRHNEVRAIWSKDFQRNSLEEQRTAITRIVDSRLMPFVNQLRTGNVVDSVVEMTRGIPTLVIAEMLAIPQERYTEFSAWSDAMGGISEGFTRQGPAGEKILADGKAAVRSLNTFIEGQLKKRRDDRGSDLISRMVHHSFSAQMSEAEIIASNTQLVFAGNETTAKLMSQILIALALYPEQRELLRSDRSLIPAAIEEIHRWHTIVHRARRIVSGDEAEVAGFVLPKGADVTGLQGIANRDPERWDDPDQLDITRPTKQHLGFGFGVHSCLGLNLARLEAQIWLDRLLDELPEWKIAGPISWGTNWVLRGPLHLPIAI
jgi:cytochrome P450